MSTSDIAKVLIGIIGLITFFVCLIIMFLYSPVKTKEEFVDQNLNKPAVDVLYAATKHDLASIRALDLLKEGKLKLDDINVQRKLHFGDENMTKNGTTHNNSDPYYLEKITNDKNKSSLRLTINNNPDEAFEIWGNSCKAGDCEGPGISQHKFQADGNVWHNANVHAKGDLVFSGSNGWIFHTPDDKRRTMYIAPNGKDGWDWKNGVQYHSNGYMDVSGGMSIKGGESEYNQKNFRTYFSYPGDGKNHIRGDTKVAGHMDVSGNSYMKGGASKLNPNNNKTCFPCKDGKNYIRGDMNVDGDMDIKGGMNIQGGASKHNPNKNKTQFSSTDGKNYIRGDTKVDGNLYSKDIEVEGNVIFSPNAVLHSKGRQHFNGEEKLLLLNKEGTIVSKAWGGNGKLSVEGDLNVNGKLYSKDIEVEGNVIFAPNAILHSKGRQHLGGEEKLFLLNKEGTIVSKAWGGNGNLSVEGDLNVHGKLITHGRTCRNASTDWNDRHDGNAMFLDRHNVECADDEVLTKFRLTTDHVNSKQRYDYRCCKL